MVDINKYLETQFALARKRVESKSTNINISQKSKAAAETIGDLQNKKLKIKHKNVNKSAVKQNTSISKHSEDDDYLPSCNEDEEEINFPMFSLPSSTRKKKNMTKIIDDGDLKQYNERVTTWRKNLSDAVSGCFKGNSFTADIQYTLNGNKDVEKFHELQNGLRIPNYIWKQLYKFQRTGVKWLWELHQLECGGLLGDEMGLGKTIQIIAFLAGLSNTNSGKWNGLGPSIIVAPATVIYQWVSHFHYWYPHLRIAVLHRTGSHVGNHHKLLRDIYSSHGILLITYEGIVKYNKDLMTRKWHYLILDEGHKIRNPETQVSKLIKTFQTPHRLLLTGSPMQNNLQELWSLFDFMRPGLLGTHVAFMEHFACPITQGGYANATEFQEATALEIAIALKNMITPYLLRRTKAEVQEYINLPEKKEQVLFCSFTQEQRDLYMGYLLSSTVRSILDKDNKYGDPLRARVLIALSTLRKICNHPDLYLYEAQEDFENIDENSFGHWKRSGKMTVVHSLLKIWQKQGHRALIFSQSRAMICLLEQYFQNQGFLYLKMDGTVSVGQRQGLIKTFNENSEYLVFLATTRVGGLGVNLTGANRVIIYDPDWNPATDNQAKERAWRIGQNRNVTVYRLLSAGTIEEKIYQRQIFKQFLSNKIFIDPNQKNVLSTSTLQGLFTLEETNSEGDTETASLFKHTKVNIGTSKDKCPVNNSYINTSHSKKKLEEMKRLARKISKKISIDVAKNEEQKDPREEYKKKRELLLNPPQVVENKNNLVDDQITNISFENVLSELEIINMHVKKDYEENLINEVLKNEGAAIHDKEKEEKTEDINETNYIEDVNNKLKKENELNSNYNEKNKRKNKRKLSVSDNEIDHLEVKVKKKKYKKSDKEKNYSDDDYVLSKLFAKAAVKNALHHDDVVGLAEKEKKYKIKQDALKRAKAAVRAIKFSTK